MRDAAEYFDDIQDVRITKDMLDLAKHTVETKAGHFEPANFEDHYEVSTAGIAGEETKRPADCSVQKGTAQQRLQPDECAARQYQRWPAHARGEPREGRGQEIQVGETARQTQGKLTSVTHD